MSRERRQKSTSVPGRARPPPWHRGTLLNAIQMRKNSFPAYLKSPGAAARTTGADSPLSFVGAIVGAYMLGLGV